MKIRRVNLEPNQVTEIAVNGIVVARSMVDSNWMYFEATDKGEVGSDWSARAHKRIKEAMNTPVVGNKHR